MTKIIQIENDNIEFPDEMSDSEIEKVLNEQYKPSTTKNFASSLLDSLKGAGQQFLSGQENTETNILKMMNPSYDPMKRINAPEPTGILQNIAYKSGEYLAPQPAIGGAPGMTEAVASKTGQLVGRGLEKIAPSLKGGLSTIGSLLTSVPKEDYRFALDNPEILMGKFDPKTIFEKLGSKAQDAINYVVKKSGEEVGAEKEAMKNAGKLNPNEFIEKIDSELKNQIKNNVSSLEPADISMIQGIKKLFMSPKSESSSLVDEFGKPLQIQEPIDNMTDDRLLAIKDRINNLVKWKDQTVSKPTDKASRILQGIYDDINKYLYPKYEGLEAANTEFANLNAAKNKLLPKVKDENVAKNLKNIYSKDASTQEAFQSIDEVAPNILKFMKPLKEAITRNKFEELLPGQGGGSGSSQGFGNIARANTTKGLMAGATGYFNPILGALLAASYSPYVHKQAIKTGSTLANKMSAEKTIPLLSKLLINSISNTKGGY